jgi:hypothetical protein
MDLSEAQAASLFAAIEEARQATSNVQRSLYGFQISWILRPKGGATRGDLLVIVPGGERLYSIVSLKRKLGLAPVAEPRERAASGTGEGGGRSVRDAKTKKSGIGKVKEYGREAVGCKIAIAFPAPEMEEEEAAAAASGGSGGSGIKRKGSGSVGGGSGGSTNGSHAAGGAPRLEWVSGTVVEFNATEGRHLVRFEDGDQSYQSLGEEEASGTLRWLASAKSGAGGGAKGGGKRAAGGAPPSVAPPKKVKKAPPPPLPPPLPRNYRPPLPPPKPRIKLPCTGRPPP